MRETDLEMLPCRELLLITMLTTLTSLAMAQVNPRATARPDIKTIELRCRGGGLQIDVSSTGRYVGSSLMDNMTIHFKAANGAAGITGQNLAPGQCALSDRALLSSEPTEMRAEVVDFAQLQRQLHGDPVYKGDQAAEKYPDAQNIPPYLANANHYWSFFGSNTLEGYFRITDLRYWRPRTIGSPRKTTRAPGRETSGVRKMKSRGPARVIC